MKKTAFLILLNLIITSSPSLTYCWIFPEHRDITRAAVEKLSPDQRKLLENLWKMAITGSEGRLTPELINNGDVASRHLIDFVSWPSISGDHSISSRDMLNIVLKSDWILKVCEIANDLKIELSEADSRDDVLNALRDSDLRFQRADPEYASRAGHNDVHFLCSVSGTTQTLSAYIINSLTEGVPLNALGVYMLYHQLALYKASYFATASLTIEEKTQLLLSALADEAFAIHFLEDFTAAGHAAGVWGDPSQKKGSHDYYNEHGIQTTTWEGVPIILVGDAWIRDEDIENTALLVKMSLEQVLNAFAGTTIINSAPMDSVYLFSPGDFNISKVDFMPPSTIDTTFITMVIPIFTITPVPALAQGLGELPRFRSELGFFIGLSASLSGTVVSRSFGPSQDYPGVISGVDATIKFGVGLDGVLSESSDGLAFLGVGYKRESGATSGILDLPETKAYGNLLSSIPARSSINIKLRCPFFLIPGDLIFTTPFLSWMAPETLEKMAAFAANGGLIPWQAGISTSIGRFQFIFGREVDVQLFGLNTRDVAFHEGLSPNNERGFVLASYKSTRIEFPILEYRPFRTFAADQSSKLFIQFYGGVDIPYDVELVENLDFKLKDLQNLWYIGFRLAFDWRYYL